MTSSTLTKISTLTVIGWIASSFSAITLADSLSFLPMKEYQTGGQPFNLNISDVNRDGKNDLITTNSDSDTVSVLLGNGNGTFKTNLDYIIGDISYPLLVSDVNRDSKPDLITPNAGLGSGLSVLLGNGNGNFQDKVDYLIGKGSTNVQAADVNRDGKPDLIAANYGNGTVSVLLGKGDGTFNTPLVYATSLPSLLQVNDVNRDGKPDLIVANRDDQVDGIVSILLGNGDGSFKPKVDYVVAGNPHPLYVNDVNCDGKPDIISASNLVSKVSVLLGKGNGAFNASVNYPIGTRPAPLPSPYLDRDLKISDVNRDGKPDLITANLLSKNVSVLLGNGDGTFKTRINYGTGSENGYPWDIQVEDINRDGKPDLVSGYWGNGNVSVFLGNGDGTFKTKVNFEACNGAYPVRINDVNRDSKPDIITAACGGNNNVHVLLNNGQP
jgi:hypothetical protein